MSYIFTIDPSNTTNFDDAISIVHKNDFTAITIYLANPFLLLESLDLWESMSDQVSTIYLPGCRRPIMPSFISENLCSLKEGEKRYAFAIQFILKKHTNH